MPVAWCSSCGVRHVWDTAVRARAPAKLDRMTRSKSPLVVVAVLILAVLAGVGYLLAGRGGSTHPKAADRKSVV